MNGGVRSGTSWPFLIMRLPGDPEDCRRCEYCGAVMQLVAKLKVPTRTRKIQRYKCPTQGCGMEYAYTTKPEEDETNDRAIIENGL